MPISSGVMNPEGVLLRRQQVEITHLVTFHRQNGFLTLTLKGVKARTLLSNARQSEVDFLHFWGVILSKFSGKSSL